MFIHVLQRAAEFPLSPMDVTEFSPLLEDVENEVKEIMIKEKKSISKGSELGGMEMMGPRIAQLKDELEKREKIITKLKKDNIALKVAIDQSLL